MYAITGSTGHLGQAILRQAAAAGQALRAVIRQGSDTEILKDLCTGIETADLADVETLTRSFDGCDVVIHCAAMIDIRRGQYRKMREVNVEGTRNVLEACRRAGVSRLVYISSIEAIDLKNPTRPVTEELGFADGNAVMDYGNTKSEASRLVSTAGRDDSKLETVLICPTGIIGPWDFHGGLTTTMIRRYLAGKIPGAMPGGFDYSDVRDVAGAVLAAAAGRGRSGEAYLTPGSYLDVRGMLEAVGDAGGCRRSTPMMPTWLVRFAAVFAEGWSMMTGRKAMFTKGSLDILQTDARIDSSKAEKDLGYRRRSAEEAINDTVSWILTGENPDPSPAWKAS